MYYLHKFPYSWTVSGSVFRSLSKSINQCLIHNICQVTPIPPRLPISIWNKKSWFTHNSTIIIVFLEAKHYPTTRKTLNHPPLVYYLLTEFLSHLQIILFQRRDIICHIITAFKLVRSLIFHFNTNIKFWPAILLFMDNYNGQLFFGSVSVVVKFTCT